MGMFEYALIKDVPGEEARVQPIGYPAFAFGSEEMKEGIEMTPYPFLPVDPNALEAFSVFVIDIEDPAAPAVIAKIKTYHLVERWSKASLPSGQARIPW